jgi:hypothetical protein
MHCCKLAFVFCMFVTCTHVTLTFNFATMLLCHPACICKPSNLGTNNLFLFFTKVQTLHLTINILLVGPTTNTPRSFCSPYVLKYLVQLPFCFPRFIEFWTSRIIGKYMCCAQGKTPPTHLNDASTSCNMLIGSIKGH